MASCWSGRRGSNSLPPPWQGGALPDELRPHIRCIYPCTLPFVSQTGPPRKLANARFCGEEEKFQCLSQRSCFARLPDKRLTFRRGASDRNRTNDTGIFSPLLYRLSYRGISGAIIPAPSRAILANFGAPAKACEARFCGEEEEFQSLLRGLTYKTARQTTDIPTSDPDRARTDDPQRDRLVL